MAKPNNEQARMLQEVYYNGNWSDELFDLVDMEKEDMSWDYFDKRDTRVIIKDRDGNVVGRINL